MTSARRHAYIKNWKNTNPSSGLDGTTKSIIQQTYTHLLVQAHASPRMTGARRHACMKNWKNTNPLSGIDGTGNNIHSANIHTSARASTRLLTYDECTKACLYEKLKTHTNPSSGLDGTTKSIHSANIHTCARASTRSLTYDECTKACMY